MSVTTRVLNGHTKPATDPTPLDTIDQLGYRQWGSPEPPAWLASESQQHMGYIDATNCDRGPVEEVNNVPVIECPNAGMLTKILAAAPANHATMIVHRVEYTASGKPRYGYLTFLRGEQIGIDATLHHARQTLLENKRRAIGISWKQIG